MRAGATMKVCHKCRREVPFDTRILRSETCPWCGAALHCCVNCRFHDPNAYNECLEVGTEFVRVRDEANYCSSFEYREGGVAGDGGEAERAKKKLEGLFKF
jgi:hypothetical protein